MDIETGATHYLVNNAIKRKSYLARCAKILTSHLADIMIQMSGKDNDVRAIWDGIRGLKKKITAT